MPTPNTSAPAAPVVSANTPKASNSAPVEAAPAIDTKAQPVIENVTEAKSDKDVQRRAAAIARAKKEEAKLVKEREAFNNEREKFINDNKVLADKARHLDELYKLSQTDPLKYIEAAGIKTDDLLKRVMKGDTRTVDEVAQTLVQAEMKKFRAEQEKMAKEREDLDRRSQQKAKDEQIADQIKTAQNYIKELAEKDAEKYEFINNTPNANELVWDLIREYHEATIDAKSGMGKILPYEEALATIEESLENSFIERTKSSKKVQARLEKEKTDAVAQAQAKLEESVKFDKFGRKVKPESKVEVEIEAKPEIKEASPVEAAISAPLSKSKKLGINEKIRQIVEKTKASLDT